MISRKCSLRLESSDGIMLDDDTWQNILEKLENTKKVVFDKLLLFERGRCDLDTNN